MQNLYKCLIIALIASCSTWAQTKVNLRDQSKTVDFSNINGTRPIQVGGSLPANCTLGSLFYLTSAPDGKNIYACTQQDVWKLENGTVDIPSVTGQNGRYLSTNGTGLQWSAPPVGTTTIRTSGSTVATTTAIDLAAGQGLVATLNNGAQGVNVVYGVDTNLVATRSYVQSGVAQSCVSTGSGAPNYTCSMNPVLTQYTQGLRVNWRPGASSTGAAITLNINSLGAKAVFLADGVSNPRQEDLVGTRLYSLWYDGTAFRIVSDGILPLQTASFCASASASGSAYTCSLSPGIPAYRAGMVFSWQPDVDATGGATTLAINGLGALPLTLADGTTNPKVGDILASRLYPVWYDGVGFRLVLPRIGANGTQSFCSSSSASSSAYTCALSPALRILEAGTVLSWTPDVDASAGGITLNVSNLGATSVKLSNGTADPQVGDVVAGVLYNLVFDGTNFRIVRAVGTNQTVAASRPLCTSTVRGRFWVSLGANNAKDEVAVCTKDASNNYAWRVLW